MNSRTAALRSKKSDPVASGFLSLGAGTRAIYPSGVPSADMQTAHGDTAVHKLTTLRTENDALPHPVDIGTLGTICRKAGLSLHVVGDEGGAVPAWGGVLMACDSFGSVDRTDGAFIEDVEAPYGRRADVSAFVMPSERALTVWVYGDLLRADTYAPLCTPDRAQHHRETALRRLATLIAERWMPVAVDAGKHGNQTWLLSPAPSLQAHWTDRLTPVALIGPDIRRGWIMSATTRRQGLIAIADVVPTIARFLDADRPPSAVGRPAYSAESEKLTAADWHRLHDEMLRTSIAQRRLGPLPNVRLVVLLALVLWASLAFRGSRATWPTGSTDRPILQSIAVGVAAATFVQCLSGAFSPMAPSVGATLLAGAAALGAVIGWTRRRAAPTAIVIACTGSLAGIGAGLCGYRPVLSDGWLSYSVMEGARYYGIGNEMAGALAAIGVVLATPLLQLRRAWLCAFGFAVLTLALAWPTGGANLGAALASASGAVFASAVACPPSRRLPATLIGSLTLVLALVAVAAVLDRGATASHVGQAFGAVGSLGAIAVRKLALNAHLLLTSPWALCLGAGVAGSFLYLRTTSLSHLRMGLTMLIVVSGVLLIANDSGVVAAGMALSVGLPALAGALGLEPREPKRVADDGDG